MATIILGKSKKKDEKSSKSGTTIKTTPKSKKAKAALPTVDVEDAFDLAGIAHRLKEIELQLSPLKALTAERAELENTIREHYSGILDDTESEEIQGSDYCVKVGKVPTKRKIVDLEKVKTFMGLEGFMKVATVTLKNIDDYLNPEEKEEVLETVTEGKRTVKVEFF